MGVLCQETETLQKLFLIMTSQTPDDNHVEVIMNCAKFDVCTSSNFGGVKAQLRLYVHTYRQICG